MISKNIKYGNVGLIAPQLLVIFILVFFTRCNGGTNDQKPAVAQVPVADTIPTIASGSFNQASGIVFDSTAINQFLKSKPLFKEFSNDYFTFYRANNFNYVWYDNKGLIESSSALISSLTEVEHEGVTTNFPYKDSIDNIFHSYSDTTNKFKPDINTELLLTGEYFYYAEKIYAGSLNSKTESINWYLPRKKLSYAALLDNNLKNGALEKQFGQVVSLQYECLKKELRHYKDIDNRGGEVVVASLKKPNTLKPKDSSGVIGSVRKRLFQLGDISEDDGNIIYDLKLADAVNQAKERYGLKTNSVIDNALIREINVPAKIRVEQIIVNMERLRWLPINTTSSEFILVNIPEYALVYYENGKAAWRCGVVVGKPMTKTVIFSGNLQYVVFSPYWYVPTSIINKEVKPGMKRDKNYLASHRMEWNGGRVRQKPGPSNSLGLVKFLFPNSNNIYLHDTPSKSLFGEDARAFSHGCVRVSQPKELAVRVLRQYPEWTPGKIDAAMHAGTEKYVTLKNTIPVYIGYFTAFMGTNGKINFRPDIYQRDNRLLEMLMNH